MLHSIAHVIRQQSPMADKSAMDAINRPLQLLTPHYKFTEKGVIGTSLQGVSTALYPSELSVRQRRHT